jgi:hypothetical protein
METLKVSGAQAKNPLVAKPVSKVELSPVSMLDTLVKYIRILGADIRPGVRDQHVFTVQHIRFYLNDEDDLITVTRADNLILLKAQLKPDTIMFIQPGNWLEKILAYYKEDYDRLMKNHTENETIIYYQNGGAFDIELPSKP